MVDIDFNIIEAEHCLITLSYTPLSCAQRRMKAFPFFQRYAPPSAPPSLRSPHLWLLQSLRRKSQYHKVTNPDFQRSKAWRTAFPALCASFLCCYLGSLFHRPMQCLWTNWLFVRHQNDKYSYQPFLIRSTLSLVNGFDTTDVRFIMQQEHPPFCLPKR